jgi:hypothetical protein
MKKKKFFFFFPLKIKKFLDYNIKYELIQSQNESFRFRIQDGESQIEDLNLKITDLNKMIELLKHQH